MSVFFGASGNEHWNPLDPRSTAWCRTHYAMMAEGGSWGVPRSGLLFRKHAGVCETCEGRGRIPAFEGNVGCPSCGAVIAWEGEPPEDCLRCSAILPRSSIVACPSCEGEGQVRELVLYGVMPHDERMPITAEQLREQQDAEYEGIRRAFEAAGVVVRREVTVT